MLDYSKQNFFTNKKKSLKLSIKRLTPSPLRRVTYKEVRPRTQLDYVRGNLNHSTLKKESDKREKVAPFVSVTTIKEKQEPEVKDQPKEESKLCPPETEKEPSQQSSVFVSESFLDSSSMSSLHGAANKKNAGNKNGSIGLSAMVSQN